MKTTNWLRSLVMVAALAWGLSPVMAGAEEAPAPSGRGFWIGTLVEGKTVMRLVVTIDGKSGALSGTFNSIDQGVQVPLTDLRVADGELSFTVVDAGAFQGRWSGAAKAWVGRWSQDGETLDLTLAWPRRPQTPTGPFGYAIRDVVYSNPKSGLRLGATLTVPPTPGRHPVVLLITGTGRQDRDETIDGHKPFAILADALTRRGIAVLRVDDRGEGQSQGPFGGATTQDFVGDVAAGVAWLRSQPEIDPDRIGLLGHSEGGLIAPLVAAKDRRINLVVLMAGPGLRGDETFLAQARAVMAAKGASETAITENLAARRDFYAIIRRERDAKARVVALRRRAAADGDSADEIAAVVHDLDTPWLRCFIDLDPAPALHALRRPVLAVLAERDIRIPPAEQGPALRKALAGNADATVVELKGLNHLMQPAIDGSENDYIFVEQTIDPAALNLMVEWIARQEARGSRR
jgi:pimeloyl-ACP methyl ester carboxylesterase